MTTKNRFKIEAAQWRWRESNPRPKDSTLECTTSVVGLLISSVKGQTDKPLADNSLRPEGPLLLRAVNSRAAS